MSVEAQIALNATIRLLRLRGYRPHDCKAASAVLREHVDHALRRLTIRAHIRVHQIHDQELERAGLAAAKEISERRL